MRENARQRERETKRREDEKAPSGRRFHKRECRDHGSDENARKRKREEENTVIDTYAMMPMPSSTSEEATYIHPDSPY